MTWKPHRACRHPGCPAVVREPGPPYCPKHLRDPERPQDLREASNKRGYDTRWTRLRNWHIRQHPVCELCGEPAEIVHHKVPVRDDLTMRLDEDNLQSLCRRCHDRIHKEDR